MKLSFAPRKPTKQVCASGCSCLTCRVARDPSELKSLERPEPPAKGKLSFSFGPKTPTRPTVAPPSVTTAPLVRPTELVDPKPSNPAQRPKQEQKADVLPPVKPCPKAERPPTRADLMAAKIMPTLAKRISKVPEYGGVFAVEFKGPIYDELMAMQGGMSDRNRTFCIAICNLHPCGLNFGFTEYCSEKKISAGFQILSKPMKPVSFRKA